MYYSPQPGPLAGGAHAPSARGRIALFARRPRGSAMLSASDALERLREGNRRFASNTPATPALRFTRRDELRRQEPFAIVLGCSDSRVPAEIIFDQGLGDLFVIRVAGNVVAPSGVGSVEFAAARFGTRLVVVLGHSGCGAVAATIEELQGVPQVHSKIFAPSWTAYGLLWRAFLRCHAHGTRRNSSVKRSGPTFACLRINCGTGHSCLNS